MRIAIARAARKQNRMIVRRFGAHKQVGKRRVRRVAAFIAQRRIEAAGHGYAPVFLGFVFQSHALEDRSILRRYGDFQPRIDSRYALFEPRTARVERGLILRAEHIIRVFIADVHVHSAARIAQIAEETVQQQIAASGEHRAARADDRRYAAAVQDMRIHGIVFGGNARKVLFAARKRRAGDFAPAPRALRFAFAQHQSQRARLRNVHEGFPDRAVAQRVAQRAQDHALVVRHVAVHDRGHALRIGVQIIRRLHHAAAVEPAQIAHFDDAVRRRGGHAAQRQRRCVGRDDVLRAFAAERKIAQTERAVLIIHVQIKGMAARFGYAHRSAVLTGEAQLGADRRAAALSGQGMRGRVQKQIGHQVFKHRAAPGKRGAFAANACGGAR